MNTVEFYIEVRDTTPIYLAKKASAPPSQAGLSYWALSADAFGPFPPVLIHVYCRGELPGDDRRDEINAALKSYVGELLTGQRGEGHIEP